ncbi:MAG: hypothetical protein H7249_03520 [Chitinophagaceae bacterium]|nr:hypothetical protein [Oligoflexus sp.]
MKILKNPIVLLIVFLMAFGSYYFQKRRLTPPSPPASKQEGGKATKEKVGEIKIVAKEEIAPATSDTRVAEAQKTILHLMAEGVIPIPTQQVNSNLRFIVKPNPIGFHCAAGDFDIMQVMTTSPTSKIFTISVESMDKGAFQTSQAYSLSDMGKKAPFAVDVPSADGAYGLYLCIDSQQKKLCSTSPNLDPHTWGQSDKKTKEMAEGHTLYFQLLVVKNNIAYVIPGAKWGKQNLEKLTQDLGPWLGPDAKYLEKMNAKLEALTPLPAVVLGHDLTIPLKYLEGKCG